MKYRIKCKEIEYVSGIDYRYDGMIGIYTKLSDAPLTFSLKKARYIIINDVYKHNNIGKFKIVPEN